MDNIFNVKVNIINDIDDELFDEIVDKLKNNKFLDEYEINYFLNNVVYIVRKMICDRNKVDIDGYDYKEMCNYAQAMLCHYFDELGVKNVPVCTSKIFFNIIRHFFTVVFLPCKGELIPYLVDPTYNQFFSLEKCDEKKFVIKDKTIKATSDPGYFVSKMNDKSKEEIKSFLQCGFHKLDNEFAKIYGDSFYYTQIGITMDEFKNLYVPGNSYVKFFLRIKNELTKSKEELDSDGLLLNNYFNFKKNNGKRV